MRMFDNSNAHILSRQPLFLRNTTQYQEYNYAKQGISHFYSFITNSESSLTLTASPDGGIDLLFCCDPENPFAFVVGSFTSCCDFTFPKFQNTKNKYFFCVRFISGTTSLFNEIAATDIVNHFYDFKEFKFSPFMFEQIVNSNDFLQQIQMFLVWYYEHQYEINRKLSNTDRLAIFLIEKIYRSSGNIQLRELVNEFSISERYINKIVQERTGFSPKFLSKIVRFHRFIDLIVQHMYGNVIDYSYLASEAGYYDQSHMIRDFKPFTNTTPVQYIATLKSFDYKNKFTMITQNDFTKNVAIPKLSAKPT